MHKHSGCIQVTIDIISNFTLDFNYFRFLLHYGYCLQCSIYNQIIKPYMAPKLRDCGQIFVGCEIKINERAIKVSCVAVSTI